MGAMKMRQGGGTTGRQRIAYAALASLLWPAACSDGASNGSSGTGGQATGGSEAGVGASGGEATGGASGGTPSGGSGGTGLAGAGSGGLSGAGSGGDAGDAEADASGGAAGADADAADSSDADTVDAAEGSVDAGPADAAPDALDAAADVAIDGGDSGAQCPALKFQCSGDKLEQCSSTGSGYNLVQDCAPAKCDATLAACVECVVGTDCAPPGNSCLVAACKSQGVCGTAPVAAGTPCAGGVCNGGGACGPCLPGAMKCTGTTLETCGSNAQWSPTTVCPFVCQGSACAGVCVPGSKRCNGNQPETCAASGQWAAVASCAGSTPSCHDGLCEPATPASCASLAGQCGPKQNGYCCASTLVSGGTFYRSYDGVSYTSAGYPATVSDFRLDVYEVSVARFREFVNAGKGTAASPPAAGSGQNPAAPGSGWSSSWNGKLEANTAALKAALPCNATYATFTEQPGNNDARPMNCLTWYEAFAFCVWDGARPPTEAEWNFAAAGGTDQRVYPWSNPPSSSLVNESYASYYVDGVNQCLGDGVVGCSINDLLGVGSLPKGVGRFGNLDLSGNVWEWVYDTYLNPYELPCTNCATTSGGGRVIRGGSFFGNGATILASARSFSTPESRLFSVGVRCARAK